MSSKLNIWRLRQVNQAIRRSVFNIVAKANAATVELDDSVEI